MESLNSRILLARKRDRFCYSLLYFSFCFHYL